MMSLGEIAELVLLGGLTGFMAGCTGVGGVFLVPGLIYGLGMGIRASISTVMLAFILSGSIGLWTFARRKSVRWDMAAWLFVGATPFAFIGAWSIDWFPPRVLALILSVLTFSSGLSSLTQASQARAERAVSPGWLGPIGAVTGFVSAITGTGGAVVLMPILLSMSVPTLTAIGLSMAVQLPIAVRATLGNYASDNLDFRTSLLLSIVFTLGLACGAKFAHALPQRPGVPVPVRDHRACGPAIRGWRLLQL